MAQVTVVVVTWNAKDLVLECVESLLRTEGPLDVLVVDNASADGTGPELHERYRCPRRPDGGTPGRRWGEHRADPGRHAVRRAAEQRCGRGPRACSGARHRARESGVGAGRGRDRACAAGRQRSDQLHGQPGLALRTRTRPRLAAAGRRQPTAGRGVRLLRRRSGPAGARRSARWAASTTTSSCTTRTRTSRGGCGLQAGPSRTSRRRSRPTRTRSPARRAARSSTIGTSATASSSSPGTPRSTSSWHARASRGRSSGPHLAWPRGQDPSAVAGARSSATAAGHVAGAQGDLGRGGRAAGPRGPVAERSAADDRRASGGLAQKPFSPGTGRRPRQGAVAPCRRPTASVDGRDRAVEGGSLPWRAHQVRGSPRCPAERQQRVQSVRPGQGRGVRATAFLAVVTISSS